MKIQTWFIIAPLVLAGWPSAFAVSRVGNGSVGDLKTGFKDNIPAPFRFMNETKDQSVVLRADRILAPNHGSGFSGNNSPLILLIKDFATEYPTLKNQSRAEIEVDFLNSGWKKTSSPNPCVDNYVQINPSAHAGIAVWGGNKGMVAVGMPAPEVANAIQALLDQVELERGACSWK
jgi:hypothetical protein